MSRRRRRRASDIAEIKPRRGLGAAALLAIGLALVIVYKVAVGEDTADFITQVTGDPALQLPPSVLDRLEAGVLDAGAPDAHAGRTDDSVPDARLDSAAGDR